jgi:hypothetical protein
VIHPGFLTDPSAPGGLSAPNPPPSKIFGTGTAAESDHVEDVWKNPEGDTEFAKAKNEIMERSYKSVQREPLGRTFVRGHVMPDTITKDPKYRHGIVYVKGMKAVEVLNPGDMSEEEKKMEEIYIKSHGSYGPGEQKRRNYVWRDGVDPGSMVWGVKGKDIALGGMSQAVYDVLHGVGDVPESTLTSKKYDDFQAMGDLLGRARNLGHGRDLPKDHIFGVAARRRGANEWDARDCVEGKYSYAEQLPDEDLGTTATPGFRNATTEIRRFGCPSVRSDIPKYARRSVADNQNYGDDVNAQYLLNPSQFAALGVEDEEFVKPRSREYIQSMFQTTGFDTSEDVFNMLFDSVCDGNGMCGVDQYRHAYNRWKLA